MKILAASDRLKSRTSKAVHVPRIEFVEGLLDVGLLGVVLVHDTAKDPHSVVEVQEAKEAAGLKEAVGFWNEEQ